MSRRAPLRGGFIQQGVSSYDSNTCIPYDSASGGKKEASVDPFFVIRTVQNVAVKKVLGKAAEKGVIPIEYYVGEERRREE